MKYDKQENISKNNIDFKVKIFNDAIIKTYEKYNFEQVLYAIDKVYFENDFNAFTNDFNVRDNLIKYLNSDDIKYILKVYANSDVLEYLNLILGIRK